MCKESLNYKETFLLNTKLSRMTAKEWLEVMQESSDFPNGMEKLIEMYGEMLLNEQKQIDKKHHLSDVIDRLLSLKRYNTCTCAGYAESGDVWTELDEDKNGELIKVKDLKRLIGDIENAIICCYKL